LRKRVSTIAAETKRPCARPAGNAWVARWDAQPGDPSSAQAGFIADWLRYLDYFTAIKDVRFKVKRSDALATGIG